MEKSPSLLRFTRMEEREWLSKAGTQCSRLLLSIVQSNLNSSAEGVISLFPIISYIRSG
jgi:hypothetical protein